jgi:hypothetical protein
VQKYCDQKLWFQLSTASTKILGAEICPLYLSA